MANRRWKIKKSVLYSLLAVAILAVIGFVERKESDKQYQSLEVYVQGISDVYFVDEIEIKQLLENEFSFLKQGNSLGAVSLKQMEERVEKHPFVKNAEVFMDLKGKVIVKIDQYRPIARIIRPMAAHGYIAAGGKILPTSSSYTTRVLTIEGAMAETLLKQEDLSAEYSDLLELIHFIEKDKFWAAQITGMEINGKKDVKLFQQVGKQVIELGKPVDIKEKFDKISLFYKEILPEKGWDAYKRVNVKYKDQIICE